MATTACRKADTVSKRFFPRPRWLRASICTIALATRARRAASAACACRTDRTTKRRSVQLSPYKSSCYVNLQEKKKTLPVSGTSHRFLHFPLCTFRCVLPRHADAFATIASFSAELPVIRGRGRSHASSCLFVRDQETFCASHFRSCWQ